MCWWKERVWQLGLAVLLALVGSAVIYLSTRGGINSSGVWIGLVLVFVALGVPLFAKIYDAAAENKGERGEC